MKVSIHAKGLNLLEEEKVYAEEKVREALHKIHNAEEKESICARYEIDKESSRSNKTKQFVCTLTLNLPGKTLRSEAQCGGVYTSVDKVVQCMKSQLNKEKSKHVHI